MSTESNTGVELPSLDEARTIVERARRLRAETLARLVRTAWARVAARPGAGGAGNMPPAHA